MLLSSDSRSHTSCENESEAVLGSKQRKAPAQISSGFATSRTLKLREAAKLGSSTGAAWIRLSVAICLKDGSHSQHVGLKEVVSGDIGCIAVQDEGACSLKPDSCAQNHEVHHDKLLHINMKANAGNLLESARELDSEHCNRPSCNRTSVFTGGGDSGLPCGDKGYAQRNFSSELKTALALPVPKVLQLGGSMDSSNMIRGDRDTSRQSSSPFVKQDGSMKISMMSGKSDITLVSAHPVTSGISHSFSCIYKVDVSTDDMINVPMPSAESDQQSDTETSISKFPKKMDSELLIGIGKSGNPAEVSCSKDASSVVCTTDSAAGVRAQQCQPQQYQLQPDNSMQ